MFFGTEGTTRPLERASFLTAINWRAFFYFAFGFYAASSLLSLILAIVIFASQSEHLSQALKAEYVLFCNRTNRGTAQW